MLPQRLLNGISRLVLTEETWINCSCFQSIYKLISWHLIILDTSLISTYLFFELLEGTGF